MKTLFLFLKTLNTHSFKKAFPVPLGTLQCRVSHQVTMYWPCRSWQECPCLGFSPTAPSQPRGPVKSRTGSVQNPKALLPWELHWWEPERTSKFLGRNFYHTNTIHAYYRWIAAHLRSAFVCRFSCFSCNKRYLFHPQLFISNGRIPRVRKYPWIL